MIGSEQVGALAFWRALNADARLAQSDILLVSFDQAFARTPSRTRALVRARPRARMQQQHMLRS